MDAQLKRALERTRSSLDEENMATLKAFCFRQKANEAIKATVSWEPQQIKQENDMEGETSSSTTRRSNRERQAPNYYGQPVMICGIEKPQEPEIIDISSDD